jgi:predicted DNA-binding transcriptional regulator YafY
VDRCASAISLGKSSGVYEIDYVILDEVDQDFNLPEVARIAVRRGRESNFPQGHAIGDLEDDWIELSIHFHDADRLMQEVLWLGEDCYIISPPHLRECILNNLKKAIALHG